MHYLSCKNKQATLSFLEKFFILVLSAYAIRSAWLAFDIPIIFIPLAYFCAPLFLIVVSECYKLKLEKSELYLSCLPLFYWFIAYIHPAGDYKIFANVLNLITCLTFVLLPKKVKAQFYRCFYWLVQIQNIIAIFLYVCYRCNVPLGFEKVLFYSKSAEANGFYYIKWHMFAVYNSFGIFYRLCGVFNEPGALGTLCAFLFIGTYNTSKKWEKLLLLVTGVLTFSLAFFVLVVVFMFLHTVKKHKVAILVPVLLIPVFLAVPYIDFGNAQINSFAARFKITDKGIAGNNRTTDNFDKKFAEFTNSDRCYFGYGDGYVLDEGSSSYKNYIVYFGYIGATLLFVLWGGAGVWYSKKDTDCLILLFMYFLSLYQRQNAIMYVWGYTVLFGGMAWIQSNKERSP